MKRISPKHLNPKISKVKNSIKIKIRGKFIPRYQTEYAAGCDLYADVDKMIVLEPGSFSTISTGIRIEIPVGYEAQVRPRSGLAKNYGIGVMNSPGTIDADYRGEIRVILFNFGKRPFTINKGDRIAQLIFNQVVRAQFQPTKILKQTMRGSSGFGSSGIKRNK